MYNTLIMSNNYVTKRQSLKLLGEILLDRANYSIMTRYIASEANLKLMMNFLRDRSRNIQFEAFHVFKVSSRAHRAHPSAARMREMGESECACNMRGTRVEVGMCGLRVLESDSSSEQRTSSALVAPRLHSETCSSLRNKRVPKRLPEARAETLVENADGARYLWRTQTSRPRLRAF